MKKRKKMNSVLFIFLGLAFCISCIYSQKAEADTGFRFQPRLEASWLDYTLTLENSPALEGTGDLRLGDTVATANIGATVFFSKIYLDLSFLHTSKGYFSVSRGSFLEVTPSFLLPLDADITTIGSGDFYHWNYTITLGYQLLDNFTFYAGYKNNNTSFNTNLQSTFHMLDDGSVTGIPGAPIFYSNVGDFDLDYEGKGPFLGGTYGFIIGEKGLLSLNLAVAYLDGDITQNGKYIDPRTGRIEEAFNLTSTGDSIGFSYGIGWYASLTEKLGYSISVKGYNYNFDVDQSDKSDFQETTYQFSLGLSYSF